jgi:hypothetical protein
MNGCGKAGSHGSLRLALQPIGTASRGASGRGRGSGAVGACISENARCTENSYLHGHQWVSLSTRQTRPFAPGWGHSAQAAGDDGATEDCTDRFCRPCCSSWPQLRFAADSPLEEAGFELPVPRKEELLLRVPDAPHAAGRAVTADPCERQQRDATCRSFRACSANREAIKRCDGGKESLCARSRRSRASSPGSTVGSHRCTPRERINPWLRFA